MAIPLIPAAGDILLKAAAVIGAGVIGLGVGELAKSIFNSRTNEQPKINVYHMTNAGQFIDSLKINGSDAINVNIGDGTSRFGNKFYVAGDKATSAAEARFPGVMLKFSMAPDAKILDLTNPKIASSLGYSPGMSHEETQNLMQNWNLEGVDAIKYPSEKNPGGVNYAVINKTILKFEGIEE